MSGIYEQWVLIHDWVYWLLTDHVWAFSFADNGGNNAFEQPIVDVLIGSCVETQFCNLLLIDPPIHTLEWSWSNNLLIKKLLLCMNIDGASNMPGWCQGDVVSHFWNDTATLPCRVWSLKQTSKFINWIWLFIWRQATSTPRHFGYDVVQD